MKQKKAGMTVYHFIVNPNACSGFGKKVWNETEHILKQKQIDYQVYFTQYRRHATKLAAAITADEQEHTIVVLGGDGTIGEIVTGITDPSKVTLGYIPIGSGNDFARGLGLSKDLNDSINMILNPTKFCSLDLGVLTYKDKKRRFSVSSGFGYDARICHEICVSKIKRFFNKIKLGKLAYPSLSISCLYRYTPRPMTVTLDGTKTLHFKKAYFATAMNLPYEGGGCKFCPDAKPDDQLLDIIVVADVPKIQALLILPTVFSGKHTHLKGVHIYRCKKAEFHSDTPLPVHSDGEPIFLQRDLSMEIESEQIRLITG